MDSFQLLCLWLMSLLAATFLGYDRGRWATGLLLGLCLGPLGVLAAGLMQPSVENLASRSRTLQHEVALMSRRDRLEQRRRRKSRRDLEVWADDVERQADAQEASLAEGLQELASDIQALNSPEPPQGDKMHGWVGWLNEKADRARSTSRNYDEQEA